MAAQPARHLTASGIGSLMAYWRFYGAVAAAQLSGWLAGAAPCSRFVDVSGPHLPSAVHAAAAGHTVVQVVAAELPGQASAARAHTPPAVADRRAGPDGLREDTAYDGPHHGIIAAIEADLAALPFPDACCVDGVIAEDRTLSRHLFTEQIIAELARVLRPGGRLFACFDSLVLGMAILAEQRQWAELTDLPCAEVVLVPWPDGTITRCFGVEQLRELFAEARLEIDWIRPRTVLSPTAVEHVLGRDAGALSHLVRAELAAHPDESVGIHLIVSARKPGRPPI